jgi:hypothetical protein
VETIRRQSRRKPCPRTPPGPPKSEREIIAIRIAKAKRRIDAGKVEHGRENEHEVIERLKGLAP